MTAPNRRWPLDLETVLEGLNAALGES